jgi:hypothetical protein
VVCVRKVWNLLNTFLFIVKLHENYGSRLLVCLMLFGLCLKGKNRGTTNKRKKLTKDIKVEDPLH